MAIRPDNVIEAIDRDWPLVTMSAQGCIGVEAVVNKMLKAAGKLMLTESTKLVSVSILGIMEPFPCEQFSRLEICFSNVPLVGLLCMVKGGTPLKGQVVLCASD